MRDSHILETLLAAALAAGAWGGAGAALAAAPEGAAAGGDLDADYRAAEGLLRSLSLKRTMTAQQRSQTMARETRKAQGFFAFAKTSVAPHAASMARWAKDPEGMAAEGRRMVEKDPSSWQGYDLLASGCLLRRDAADARVYFEKALDAAPDLQKDWYRYMLATTGLAEDGPDKSLGLYEGIIARNDNWLAVKSSYIRAGLLLVGRDDEKAAAYFDRGLALHPPAEREALLKAGACGRFKDAARLPAACGGAETL